MCCSRGVRARVRALTRDCGREDRVCDGGRERHGGESVQAAQQHVQRQPLVVSLADPPVPAQHGARSLQVHRQRRL